MRLKQIPQNTVVHTPTEAEAKELLAILHENGYKWKSGSDSLFNPIHYIAKEGVCIEDGRRLSTYLYILSAIEDKCTILTLAEFLIRYLVFEVGDRVRINGEIQKITNITYMESGDFVCRTEDGRIWNREELKPYTEPETKPTEDMETKENRNLSQVVANCDKSEDKQLNLCELLKGHEGERFYSPAFEDVKLINSRLEENRICIDTLSCFGRVQLMENGTVVGPGECILFPSRALYEQYPLDPYTAWMKWQEKQLKCKMYLMIEDECNENLYADSYIFHNTADRDKCISEIKAIIEKYSKK